MAGSGGIQTSVGIQPAPAVAGDWASANPRHSVIAGPGGLVSGAAGVAVGRFAWWSSSRIDPNGTPIIVNNFGAGLPTGLVHRDQQGLITTYLANATQLIVPGQQMTLMNSCDMWVKNDGATECNVGMKAFTNFADGKITFAAAGTAAAVAASATGSIAASTGSFTGSIADNVLTISVVGAGVAVPGGTLSGTGVATGTKIVSQLSGTAGGVGTYAVSIGEQTVASTAIAETYGTFTAASVLVGTFGLGQLLTGTGISVPTTITALGTGAGGLGTYIVDVNTVVGSTTISANGNIETKWIAFSSGLAGELVKISNVTIG